MTSPWFRAGYSIESPELTATLWHVDEHGRWGLTKSGLILVPTAQNKQWSDAANALIQIPGIPAFERHVTIDGERFSLWRGPEHVVPTSQFSWKSVQTTQAIEALELLAWTIDAIHDEGFELVDLRPQDLLWDEAREMFWIAAVPTARRISTITPDVVWRDIQALASLLFEHLTDTPYPGARDLTTILQSREAQARAGLNQPGFVQILAGACAPSGDARYERAYEMGQALDQLLTETHHPLTVHVGARSTVGNHVFRRNNQDSCGHVMTQTIMGSKARTYGFFCVADGVGGVEGGERASNVAVQEACRAFSRAWANMPPEELVSRPTDLARGIAKVVSQTLAMHGEFVPQMNKGGTTFTGVLLADEYLGLAHVGDSWAGLVREGKLTTLTREHTLAAILKETDNKTMPVDHVSHRTVSRSMDTSREIEVSRIDGFCQKAQRALHILPDSSQQGLQVQRGDLVLLASDGLFAELKHADIVSEIARYEGNPQALCDALVLRALDAITRDNITVMALLVT